MLKPKFLILSGEGLNCERETKRSIDMAGGEGVILPIGDFFSRPQILESFQGLILPGGFSYGDELGSGRILAKNMEYHLQDELLSFIDAGRAVLGICNGFQVLVELGIFGKQLALTTNDSGEFIDQWVMLNVDKQKSHQWFHLMSEEVYLPIRHKEGKLVSLENSVKGALFYQEDVNGSQDHIAALTNQKGNVLGMMPHPEIATYQRSGGLDKTQGLQLFQSIVTYQQQS